MRTITLRARGDLAEWRDAARGLLAAGVAPRDVEWRAEGQAELFTPIAASEAPAGVAAGPAHVPKAFLDMAGTVICHSDPGRFALLYRLLARLRDDRNLLTMPADADVIAARMMEKSVRRDSHKMKAFVRFREIDGQDARRRFVAWFEPDHFIIARTAPFFARRFADMDWMILTPKGSAAFSDGVLDLCDEPAQRVDLVDATDDLWRVYYASIFNPARLKTKAMTKEMPKKYWRNLPEARLIPELISSVPARLEEMAAQQARQPPAFHDRLQARWDMALEPPQLPDVDTLAGLRAAAAGCTRCPLHCQATQTVFGVGPDRADLMLVGEQPGDMEDLAGRPFVGPAGQVLDAALAEAGLDRASLYITNAVKHFRHEVRGRRRIHQTPDARHVELCRWWLEREIDLVRPRVIVALGATALHALTGARRPLAPLRGRMLGLTQERGLIVTVHPSYLLRVREEGRRQEETRRFHDDLRLARQALEMAPISGPAEDTADFLLSADK